MRGLLRRGDEYAVDHIDGGVGSLHVSADDLCRATTVKLTAASNSDVLTLKRHVRTGKVRWGQSSSDHVVLQDVRERASRVLRQ